MSTVITGMSINSPLGNNLEEFWDNIVNSLSATSLITRFNTDGYTRNIGTEIKEKKGKLEDILLEVTIQSFQNALTNSKLNLGLVKPEKIGLSFGTSNALNDKLSEYWDENNYSCINEGLATNIIGHAANLINSMGPKTTFVTACAASTNALGYGLDLINSKKCDVVIVGGGDILSPIVFSGFCALGALSNEKIKPFSNNRDGVVLGEGVGWIVLEDEEHAKKRNAHIYSKILGYGLSNDCYHATAPDPNGGGAIRAMNSAIANSSINIEDIHYINAHGTGTGPNDEMELKAIKEIFHTSIPPISSTKSQFGHALGGAGIVEAITTILAIKNQYLPPTVNCNDPMDLEIDFVPSKGRLYKIDKAMSNSFGFGGNTASIIFEKYKMEESNGPI